MMKQVIELTDKGLFCPAGNFYIDPWRPVENAIITHGHSDHARVGSKKYFSTRTSAPILRHRLGHEIDLDTHEYGKPVEIGEATVSFHPAGHVLGSAQIRVEVDGEVWVASGDYKRSPDSSCEPFEVVKCDTFISEATFALPVYKWESGRDTAQKIFQWWQSDLERPSLLFCYSLGKAQRILQNLDLSLFCSQYFL